MGNCYKTPVRNGENTAESEIQRCAVVLALADTWQFASEVFEVMAMVFGISKVLFRLVRRHPETIWMALQAKVAQ